ncbi:MAG: TIGR04283 family arsenosugar biosynthesis glycosyltransferase [Halofilum sp. (in: g-proteobacteria)]
MRISAIVPALNEGVGIAATLRALAPVRENGGEIVVVDGGSDDDTVALAKPLSDRVIHAPRGRARQMNAGAAAACGDVLWFVHADTIAAAHVVDTLRAALASSSREWGRFDVRLAGTHPALRLVAWSMNLRSRLSGIATGDQGIFVSRDAFDAVGGFPEIPLMEDIALSRALRRRGRPLCLRAALTTSGRRWQDHGIARTVLLMWRLRFAYWRGADPAVLARRYRGGASGTTDEHR